MTQSLETFDPFDPDAWVDTPGCEPFEIALEMRARNALAPSALVVLEAHLAACPSCRAHASGAEAVDAALAVGTPVPTDWQPVEQRIAANVRHFRRLPWTFGSSTIVGCGLLAVVAALFGMPLPSLGLMTTSVAFVMAAFGAVYYWNLRRRRALFATHDVIAAYRKELERSLLVYQRLGPWSLIALLCFGGQALFAWHDLQHGDGRARVSLFTAALCSVSPLLTLVGRPRAMRRLRRAIAELN